MARDLALPPHSREQMLVWSDEKVQQTELASDEKVQQMEPASDE